MKIQDPKKMYREYRKFMQEKDLEIVLDENDEPVMIRTRPIGEILNWSEWLGLELEEAIELEEYEYCHKLKIEINKLEKNGKRSKH
jgi:hypothetical protein